MGLVNTHVSADSPAAQAGLKQNDVLTELAGQALVLPAQLRKLVRARKPGDKVELSYYRAGKKETASVTLDKSPARFGLFDEGGKSPEDMLHLEQALSHLHEIPGAASAAANAAIQAQRKALQEALRNIGPQKAQSQAEIRRGMAQAREATEEAAHELEHNKGALQKEGPHLKDLLRSGGSVDDNATVVVRSKGKSSRTLVKTDENGTLILIGPPPTFA